MIKYYRISIIFFFMWWKLSNWPKEVDVVKPIETGKKQLNNPVFEWIKVDWLWEKSYNQFIKAIENKKWTPLYNKMLKLLSDKDLLEDVKDYIEGEWYPVSNKAIKSLLSDFLDDWDDLIEKENKKQEKKYNEWKEENKKQEKKYNEWKEENKKQEKKYNEWKEENKIKEKNNNESLKIFSKKLVKLEKALLWKPVFYDFINYIKEWNIDEIKDFLLDEENLNRLMISLAVSANESGDDSLLLSTKKFIESSFPDLNIWSIDFYKSLALWKTKNINWLDSIVWDIENWSLGYFKINLDNSPAKTNLSLIWGWYSFDEKINDEEVNSATDEYLENEWLLNEWLSSLSKFSAWYSELKNNFWKIYKEEFRDNLGIDWKIIDNENFKSDLIKWFSATVTVFRMQIISKMTDMYDNLDIPESMQIKESEISDLWETPFELKKKFENIEKKIENLSKIIDEKWTENKKDYEEKVRTVVNIDEDKHNNQLKTLKIINDAGWGLFNESLLNTIVWRINRGSDEDRKMLWFKSDINFSEWNLWFSDKFWDSEKREKLWEFFNWLISWTKDWPLNVVNIKNGYVWYWDNYWDIMLQISKMWDVWWINTAIDNLKKSKTDEEDS